MASRSFKQLLLAALSAGAFAACSDDAPPGGNSGGGGAGLTGGGFGGAAFNQCGVAAPLPSDGGLCRGVTAPAIADFDDYVAGTAAGSYAFYLNGRPPAADAVPGGIVHVDDGSGATGTSVIATQMITGAGDAGYALQISNTNAINWGGLLLFYFPPSGATPTCLNAESHGGVAFSIKGAAPSGRFGVNVGMRDTIPTTDNGSCDNATASDCKNANIELTLPANATTWMEVQVPWSAFTPGVGSGRACVPLTGQNIVNLVIQPFMSYPPPTNMFAPGPYSIAVDNVRFY